MSVVKGFIDTCHLISRKLQLNSGVNVISPLEHVLSNICKRGDWVKS